jgi:hypothetical protein
MPQTLGPMASMVPGRAEPAGGAVSGLADQASGALDGLAERAGAPAGVASFGGPAEQAAGAFGASGGSTERAGDPGSGTPPAAAAGSGDTATDEDLEKKIAPMFDKFADRLRNELRHQRERAGRLTDL